MFSNRTLLVRHYRVYYPVRIHLIQHMVSAMQRLGFTTSVSEENLDNTFLKLFSSVLRKEN